MPVTVIDSLEPKNAAFASVVDANYSGTDTTNFNGVLSGTDTDVQTALETIDDHGHTISDISDFSSHTHTASDITDFDTEVSNNTTVASAVQPTDFTSGRMVYYDGTSVRTPLYHNTIDLSGNVSTSGTTALDYITSSISTSSMSNTSLIQLDLSAVFQGTTGGDSYRIELFYWTGSAYTQANYSYAFMISRDNDFDSKMCRWVIDQSGLASAPAASGGNYLWKTTIRRINGTGTVNIKKSSTNPSQQLIQEV